MKKYLLVLLLFSLGLTKVSAQFDLGAGMGLAFFNSPELSDYINGNFANPTNRLNTFNSSADFFVELGYNIDNNHQIAIEYNFNIFSYNSPLGGFGIYNLTVDRHKPTIIGYYVVPGIGYKFKFGAGVGIRILQAEETIYGPINYSTTGIGFLLKLQGDTKLSENFYALIAGELRYDLPGEVHTVSGGIIGFNSLSVGLKLGVTYYF